MIFHNLQRYQKILAFYFIALSFFYIVLQLYINKPFLSEKYNPAFSQKRYENSQWSISTSVSPIRVLDSWAAKNNFNGWGAVLFDDRRDTISRYSLKKTLFDLNESRKISDTELYAYAGYKYIHGQNPVYLNAEVPPLGKYIVGLSILIFKNPFILSIFFSVCCLPLIFLITKEITKSSVAASLAVFLTTFQSLFIDQMVDAPQLDIFQLFFFLLFIYVFFLYEKKKNVTLLLFTGVIFGLFLSIKLAIISFLIINGMLALYFILKRESIKNEVKDLLVINFIGAIVFVLTYFSYFIQGGTIHGFLSVQKWIYAYYSNSHIDLIKLLGSYIPLILINKWRFWSDGYPFRTYEHWSLLWPIVYVTGIIAISKIALAIKTYDYRVKLLLSFFVVYSAILCVITIYPRYLLILFVPLHIIIAAGFAKILKHGTH